MDYCIYLTVYKGNILPRRYIGSSTVSRVLRGYNGTIKSRKYRAIYREEQQFNKHLFKTRILARYATQTEAVEAERQLQLRYDVVVSDRYTNMSIANPNGFFGRGVRGKDHPRWGKIHTDETNAKISASVKKAYLENRIVSPFLGRNTHGENNAFFGKKHNTTSIEKMRKPKSFVPKWQCPHCGKLYDGGNFDQHLKRTLGWSKEQSLDFRKTRGTSS